MNVAVQVPPLGVQLARAVAVAPVGSPDKENVIGEGAPACNVAITVIVDVVLP